MRFSRHQMYKNIFSSLSLPLAGKILGVSGLKYFTGSKNLKLGNEIISKNASITEADYPDISMLKLPYPNETFDVVISDQVIEHIEGNVQQAIEESRRVLKKGGIAIHTTVCMQPIHWGPKDLWRFTPDGLRYLCKNFSEIITCQSWGNRLAHILFLLSDSSRDWQISNKKFSIVRMLAEKNDPVYPLMVWIVAKK